MKKIAMILVGVAFVFGASFLSITAKAGSEKQVEVKEHNEKKVILTNKDFQYEVMLIDPRTNDVIKKFVPERDLEKHQKDMMAITNELALAYDRPMLPVKLDQQGNIIGGQSRVILDEEKLFAELSEITAFERTIELPIEETAPNVTTETLQGINEGILASFTTSFNPSVFGRTENIRLSSEEINQIVLGPGDRFYFNSIVGDTTADKGYQLATVIINKEFVEGYGGGVCQTSSTLYNAIEKAGLKILELHHHSKEVGYVPKGKDATIAYGYKDFKFMNDKDFPVMIRTIVDKTQGTLEVQVSAATKYLANR
ncbi:VanW family protein [Bacillus timonensis]|nr:VanW family protein [Bacillus timonensis]